MLTIFEAESAVWIKVEKALTERLQTMRERNDGNLTADETANLRGRISEIKRMLEWRPAPAAESID